MSQVNHFATITSLSYCQIVGFVVLGKSTVSLTYCMLCVRTGMLMWNEKSSCSFFSFRVSQSPMNVHLIILFRERQACQALVWCCECCSFDFLLNLTKPLNCMLCFKLHLDKDAFGQPTYCNRGYKKRAKQLHQTSLLPQQPYFKLIEHVFKWSFIPKKAIQFLSAVK